MQAFTAVLAASSLLAFGSASPIAIRANMCGSKPSGSGSQKPLSTSANINTAAACQTSCQATSSCLSFCFGMVNSADQCMLFSVAAASVPTQSSANLLVFDKACTSVPSVVPTSSNPTGSNTGTGSSGNPGKTGNGGSGNSPTSPTNPKSGGNTGSTGNKGPKLARANTCGGAPTGPTGTGAQAPLSTPANIASMPACKAACQANKSCKSFEFGAQNRGGANVCKLFSVAASSVPAPGTGQTFKVYDVGCSV